MSKPQDEFESSYLEGRNSVFEALSSRRDINKMWILEPAEGQRLDRDLAAILREAKERRIVVSRVSRNVLNKMSTTGNHQGVIAQVASHDYVDIDDVA